MGLEEVRVRNAEAAATAYRKAIEQRGGYYPEAHQDLGRVLYAMGDLEAANEEYSIAVRQRNPRHGEPTSEREEASATRNSRKRRRSEVTAEELGAALRQAPAAADAGRSADAMAGRSSAREASSANKDWDNSEFKF